MPAAVKRRTLLLLLALGVSVVFAAWQWFRPYDWSRDEAAGYRVSQCMVERDHSNLWLRVFLKQDGDNDYDMLNPARLLTSNGKEHEPADTDLSGNASRKMDTLVFSFWLTPEDLAGPINLKLNEGSLTIRTGNTAPSLPDGGFRVFNSSSW
jgi:hypothetical protein